MMSDVEPLFVCSLAVSLGTTSIQVLCHLKIELFAFLLLSYNTFLYILDTTPLEDTGVANIFSHSGGALFSLSYR